MLFCYELFENIWGFIVQSVKLRFEFSVWNYFEDVGIGIFYRVFSAVWYRSSKDGIAVKIKDNKKVIIAADGWYEKLTCLISAYFSSDGLTINVSMMIKQNWCLFVWQQKWRWRGCKCVFYCVVAGCDIIWFFVFGYSTNDTGCWNGSVHICVKRGLYGWKNVGSLCMHVEFECGFINWSIFCHLVYS